MSLKIYSYAKITLFLDVIDKRPDNYHEIKIILQNINLSDFLLVQPLPYPKFFIYSNYSIPLEENLIYKAYKEFIKESNIKIGCLVYHIKRIPIQGGLGGGSSNAASFLCALNFLTKARLNKGELASIGSKLGSDVPFFIYGGTSLIEGRGEKVKKLPSLPPYYVMLITPSFGIRTKEIYSMIKKEDLGYHLNWDSILRDVKEKRLKELYNFFEEIVFKKHKIFKELKEILLEFTPLVSLSGTGSSIYALFEDKRNLDIARSRISSYNLEGLRIGVYRFIDKGFLLKR